MFSVHTCYVLKKNCFFNLWSKTLRRFFKKKLLHKWLKDMSLIYILYTYIRMCVCVCVCVCACVCVCVCVCLYHLRQNSSHASKWGLSRNSSRRAWSLAPAHTRMHARRGAKQYTYIQSFFLYFEKSLDNIPQSSVYYYWRTHRHTRSLPVVMELKDLQ